MGQCSSPARSDIAQLAGSNILRAIKYIFIRNPEIESAKNCSEYVMMRRIAYNTSSARKYYSNKCTPGRIIQSVVRRRPYAMLGIFPHSFREKSNDQ